MTEHPCLPAHAGVYPGLQARIQVPMALLSQEPLSLSQELQLGTYGPSLVGDPIQELEHSGLQGKGGAGFAAAVKWRAVAEAAGPKVVVANGEEGEPASFKDRWLLLHRPHLVLEGLLQAARAVQAERAIVYLSHPETVESVRTALGDLYASAQAPDLRIEMHVVKPTYVAGEETAVCRAINGGPALPTAKPPRPFEAGVDKRPTLVSNVETLAHAAWILRHGAPAYREQGTEASPGTTLVTLGGACRRPGVYEVPMGLTIEQLFTTVGGGYTSPARCFMVGGWFGGMLSARHAEVECSYSGLRAAGTAFGCGAFMALGQNDDALAFAAEVASWYARESARQCGPCIKGTQAIATALKKAAGAGAQATDRDNLVRWGDTLSGRGACAFLDGASNLARTVMREFGDEVQARAAAKAPLPGMQQQMPRRTT